MPRILSSLSFSFVTVQKHVSTVTLIHNYSTCTFKTGTLSVIGNSNKLYKFVH